MTENKAVKLEAMEEKKEAKPLHPNNMVQAEFAYLTFYIVPPHGITLEDMKNPAFWCHVASKLSPGSRIEVDSEDGSYYAKFKVTYCSKMAAHVVVLDYKEFDAKAVPTLTHDREAFHIRFNGPIAKWCVVRKADKVLLEKGLSSADEAETWLKEYLKTQG